MKQTIQYIIIFAAIVILSSAAYSAEHMNGNVTLNAQQINDNTYEFVCEADFTASNYEWDLDDGNQTLASITNTIEHEFAPGNYEITCTAYNLLENMSGTANYMLSVFQPIMLINDTEFLEEINVTENESNETYPLWNFSDNITNTSNESDNEPLPIVNITENESTTNVTNQSELNETSIIVNETNETTNESLIIQSTQNNTDLILSYDRISNGKFIFYCQAEGFTPQVYDWNFGDGTTSYDVQDSNATHTYATPGTKTVFCGAWSSTGIYETATIRLDVTDIEPLARVNVLQNNDPSFAFDCETDAFVPETYDWDFGDGTMHLDVNDQARNHTYDRNGFFSVACTAWDQDTERIAIGYIHINVTNAMNSTTGDMYIMREQLSDNTYRFTCITPTMNPIAYDWEVYDVYGSTFERREHDVSHNMITQTFDVDGKYVISCTATDLEKTIIDWQFLTIQGTNSEYMIVQETSEEEIPDYITQLLVTDDKATVILSKESRGDLLVTVQTDLEKAIDLRALVENNRATILGSITFESDTDQRVIVRIPENTTITADGTWNGMLLLPHQGNLPNGMTEDVTSVIKIGSDTPLTFDRAVRMVFENRAGEHIAIEHNGVLNNVTRICEMDRQAYGDSLPAGTSCVISIDNDLVLWTKSFSQFITYKTTESTPQLLVTQEQRAFNTALEERERVTMQTYDIETPTTTTTPTGQATGDNALTRDSRWNWALVGLVLLGIIIAISVFRNTDNRNENLHERNRRLR